jgi:hypothetical protein
LYSLKLINPPPPPPPHTPGTLPCRVKLHWLIKESELDHFQSNDTSASSVLLQDDPSNDMEDKEVGHTVLLRTLGTSEGRIHLWKRAYRWVVNMIRIEKTSKQFGTGTSGKTNQTKFQKGGSTHSMKTLKDHAAVVEAKNHGSSSNSGSNINDHNINPFEKLRQHGDKISAYTSSVVHAYEKLRINVERNFNLHREMLEHFGDGDGNTDTQQSSRENANSRDGEMSSSSDIPQQPEERETSLPIILSNLKKARYTKENLYRTSPSAATPHLRVFPSTLSSISHSIIGVIEVSLNLSRPGKFQATLVATPIGLPGAVEYSIPLVAYGESVELALNTVDALDFGIVPYGKSNICNVLFQ